MGLEEFLHKLEAREAKIGIVGLGYVGFPVAVSFAEAGFSVLGVDVDPEKVGIIQQGRSFLSDVADELLGPLVSSGRLQATTDLEALQGMDATLICVPTPLFEGTPDLSHVESAARAVADVVHPGMLVVLESTTYPGTTEEILRPILEAGGLKAGRDFFLAFSPERIDPGNPTYTFTDIPKVVGGIDEGSTKAAAALYEQVVPKVFTVSSPGEAELAKLIENTFRHVNIALVNELAVYADELGLDIWQAIEAAATKPFGFLPFWPGPGWGGHCIPLDPAYLSYRVRKHRDHEVRFVELAHAVNSEMPRYVVERATLLLNDRGKPVRGSKILGIGVAYKGGTDDTRGSPSVKVLSLLIERGGAVDFHDPLVGSLEIAGSTLSSVALEPETLRQADLVLILSAQRGVDWDLVRSEAGLVLDACNALGGEGGNIVRL